MSKRKAGEEKNTNNPIVAAPAANVNVNAAYDMGVRVRVLDQTTLIPDLVAIIQEYTAFSGVERLTLSGHTVKVISVAVFPNGNIFSSSSDKSIKIWNRVNGQCMQTLTGKKKEYYMFPRTNMQYNILFI